MCLTIRTKDESSVDFEKHHFLTGWHSIMTQCPFTFDFCRQIIKRVIIAKYLRVSSVSREPLFSSDSHIIPSEALIVPSSERSFFFFECQPFQLQILVCQSDVVHDSRVSLTLPSSTSWFLTYFERFSISHQNHLALILHGFAWISHCRVGCCVVSELRGGTAGMKWWWEGAELVVTQEERFACGLI